MLTLRRLDKGQVVNKIKVAQSIADEFLNDETVIDIKTLDEPFTVELYFNDGTTRKVMGKLAADIINNKG